MGWSAELVSALQHFGAVCTADRLSFLQKQIGNERMISISRRLAKQLRTVLRRALAGRPRHSWSPILLQAGATGLCIQLNDPEVSIEYREPGVLAEERILLPAKALDDFQGAADSLVELQATSAGACVASWTDAGVPLANEYDVIDPEKVGVFPATPESFVSLEPDFLKALHEASATAARDQSRYALRRLQLRGAAGEVIATDGRQLLIQGGFSFPWKDDVLIPAVGVFGGHDLTSEGPIEIARSDTHVVVRMARWSFYFAIDAGGRFPDVHCIVPAPADACTTWRLESEDGAFLARALPKLPGADDSESPVTVDLNGHSVVRAKAAAQGQPTELVLNRSKLSGPPVRFCANRHYLARSLQLGFADLAVIDAEKPIVCRDGRRTYLWITLPKQGSLAPSEDSLRIASDQTSSNPNHHERKEEMNSPAASSASPKPESVAEKSDEASLKQPGINGLIADAEALKTSLRETFERASRLANGLKRHRKQSKLMATTLASLRQLQSIAD
jgi:hypothetical protein